MTTIYCGKGWRQKYSIKISLKKDDLEKLPLNKYGEYELEVCERREPDQKSGATHYVKQAYQKGGES